VDDSRAFLASARALLESQGMTVSACASSSEEALAAAAGCKFDLALIDVELGGEDGLALARLLSARDPALRVVLISAYTVDDIAELVAGCGAAGFISKTALGRQAIAELLES
jgi:DNA-binding NarL/FixJ family response regulator